MAKDTSSIIKSALATIGTVIVIGLILFAVTIWWMAIVLIICTIVMLGGVVWVFMFFKFEVFDND
jgi:hypothetical protein